MTLSTKGLFVTFSMTSISIMTLSLTTIYHYAEYRILCIVMLSVITPVFKVPTPLLPSISPSSTLRKVPGKGSGVNVTKPFTAASYNFCNKLEHLSLASFSSLVYVFG
jgi:hypothetical protein